MARKRRRGIMVVYVPGVLGKAQRKRNPRLVRFGPYIDALRREQKYSTKELAEMAGIHQITLRKKLSERIYKLSEGLGWRPSVVRKLCLILRIPLNAVMYDGRQYWVDTTIAEETKVKLEQYFQRTLDRDV